MEIFAVSEVSSGSYCNHNANSGTETDAAKLFLYGNLWQLQTVKNSVPCLFAVNEKQLWIAYSLMVTNADAALKSI